MDANINTVIVIVLDVTMQLLEMSHYICNVFDTDNVNVSNTTKTFAWLFVTILCLSDFVVGL